MQGQARQDFQERVHEVLSQVQVQDSMQQVHQLYLATKYDGKHHEDPQSVVVHRGECHQCAVA